MKAIPAPTRHRAAAALVLAPGEEPLLLEPDLAEALDDELEPPDATADAPSPDLSPMVAEALAMPADNTQLSGWMERIVDRDERALAALYDATLPRVYGLVVRVVRKPELAAEVVEDTYFQVWRQAARFDAERGQVFTWLLGMARSRAIDALRREARFRADSLDDEATEAGPSDDPAADDLLDVARQHAELHQALMRLQAQPRQLLALAFFRGLSHEEIASQTLLPLGTVKSQIRRALILLRQLLGDDATTAPQAT